MKPSHILLALAVCTLWGANFVVAKLALNYLPPISLTFFRFFVAAIPAVAVTRPKIPMRKLVALSLFWFVLQYAFLFSSMEAGLPAGLASVLVQAQAFFTIAISGIFFRERVQTRQYVALTLAGAGLAIIAPAAAPSGSMSWGGIALVLAGAASWGYANVLLRRQQAPDMVALVSWLSVVSLVPLLLLSILIEGTPVIYASLMRLDLEAAGLIFLLGAVATTACCAGWGHLLRLYPPMIVSPFALLVPVFGMGSSAVLLGERFSTLFLAGAGFILLGLAVLHVPVGTNRDIQARALERTLSTQTGP